MVAPSRLQIYDCGRTGAPIACLSGRPHGRGERRRSHVARGAGRRAGVSASSRAAMRRVPRGWRAASPAIDADAEEIVQEALLRVWTNAPRWRPLAPFAPGSIASCSISASAAGGARRSCRSRRPATRPIPPPTPAGALEQREADRTLAAAIAELPERQRAAHRAHL